MSRVGLDKLGNTTERARRLRGVYLGIVTSNSDGGADSRHRVRLRFPWLPEGDESHWARILAPMAGPGRGTYFLPEIDDQVLVVFEHGDISRPVVVGGVWSEAQRPPQRNRDGKNSVKVIKSRSGHRLIFDDTAGKERLIVVDATRRSKVVLDAGGDALTIESAGDIELLAPSGAVKLAGKTVVLTASGSMSGGGASLTVSGAAVNVASSGALALSGGQVELNPPGAQTRLGAGAMAVPVDAALDQVRERAGGLVAAPGGAAVAGLAAAGGSPAAREEAAGNHLPDEDEAPPTAVVGASAGAAAIRPGDPVEVSATCDGADSAHYEVVDADTGEVIERGPAQVRDGRATATWDSRGLDRHPRTTSVDIRMHAGGATTATGALPVVGRDHTTGGPSPSNHLIDPRQPMPVADHRAGAAPAVPRSPVDDHRGPVEAAPTVDHRGRALDAQVADHRGAGVAGDVRDRRSMPTDSASAQRATGADVRPGRAGADALDGDASGATGAVAGAQVGAAVAGDASGAAGGGSAGMMVDGDVKGAAVAEGHVDSRAARIDSSDDVEREATDESVRQGKESSGIADGERKQQEVETDASRRRHEVESEADVQGRARGEVQGRESQAMGERFRAEREVSDAQHQVDVKAQADAEVQGKQSEVRSEQFRAEREVRTPETEANRARYEADSRTHDARDPEDAADRHGGREVSRKRGESGVGDGEQSTREAEQGADDPQSAAKQRVRKLDEE